MSTTNLPPSLQANPDPKSSLAQTIKVEVYNYLAALTELDPADLTRGGYTSLDDATRKIIAAANRRLTALYLG